MVEELDSYKRGFYIATALGILAVFVLSYVAWQNETVYQTNMKSCEKMLQNQSEYLPAGQAVTMMMQDFATQLNTSKENLILDCRNTVFLDDRYGICVIREKSNNNSFLVTMRLNFTKVE